MGMNVYEFLRTSVQREIKEMENYAKMLSKLFGVEKAYEWLSSPLVEKRMLRLLEIEKHYSKLLGEE